MINMSKSRQFTLGILLDAFWKLYRNHDIEKITIKKITDTAGYNRITFYDYFQDIYDALDCLENKILSDIEYKLHILIGESASTTNDTFLEKVVSLFEEYQDFLERFFSDSSNTGFEKKLQNFIKSLLTKYSSSPTNFTNIYVLEFYTSGLVGALRMWFKSDFKTSLKAFLYVICPIIKVD
ncbi:TetR/AcrR family transcriptional regulator C-terminal domain-containing protein [Ruminiclostridium papyrosolvens]|uniref:TetR family transcriptional regulator n=1 Tax=Ruminiclostridium papyrosolvens C7 TaxID=1330534 RepID=U4QXX7_9FIRM|nr:TetR/AcrR family transcriptional regulator C-terminal domain-containing protein [Ruminiclostridium papyrosolvens]EPR09326.1 TetR family transcriptional regulator [Ruminiclostridium papyrosolvens C7]